jgi:arylsulfate sulfotransferase
MLGGNQLERHSALTHTFRPITLFSSFQPSATASTNCLRRIDRLKQRKHLQSITTILTVALLAVCVGCGSSGSSVASTSNPQVAVYVFNGRSAGTVTVEFGPTTAYGFDTAPQGIPSGGAPIRIIVAGMRANTMYHMRAVAKYSDGSTETDADHTFTTSSYAANNSKAVPQITATTASGKTPQPGIEIVNELETPAAPLVATDLSGNVIWAYIPSTPIAAPAILQAPKLLPNGDFLFVIGPSSSEPIANPAAITPTTTNVIREIDLVGNTVKEITIAQLNAELQAANYNNLTLQTFHHDVTVLPNGHWLVITNTFKSVVLTGQTTPTQVLGDVIIDLDTNLNPVWVWNEFDHLDVNRHPWIFPDWTHTNAVVYSKDDGDILVSMRHQNWLVKVDYNNGAGTGNILWHLGEGGDFTLQGGVNPTDWFYAQHGPSFTTANTSGIFGLVLYDNGNDRLYPPQYAAEANPAEPTTTTCGTNGAAACYSSVPIFQINEATKTATFTYHSILPANLYADFGGNAEVLANGDVEFDSCGLPGATPHSQMTEMTDAQNSQPVWNLQVNGGFVYRGYRLPSLYPGVQW